MAQARANGIAIEYELAGPSGGPVLLMIHGVGAQMTRWPAGLLERLQRAGFQTLRFDNRDVGLSTHMDGAAVPDIAAVIEARRQGREPELPYTLSDMAADAAGLLDALGIEKAHVMGVSLGGMIAQMLAIEHGERVLSLAIVMSASGNPAMPPSKPEALGVLSRRAPNPWEDREGYLRHQVELSRTVGSPDYPASEEDLRAGAMETAERAWNPVGSARHLGASRGSADRRPGLRALTVPALVIHGVADPLIPVENGRDIAQNIKSAWLIEVNGMGHDLPAPLFELFVSAIGANCARA